MKKIKFCISTLVAMMIIFSIFSITAFASPKDDISATMAMNEVNGKTEVKITITNESDSVLKNLKLESAIPRGVQILEGEALTLEELAGGNKHTFRVIYDSVANSVPEGTKIDTPKTPVNKVIKVVTPKAGDQTNMMIPILVGITSLCFGVYMYHKYKLKLKKTFSILLICMLTIGCLGYAGIRTNALEQAVGIQGKMFVDGIQYEYYGVITYDDNTSDDNKPRQIVEEEKEIKTIDFDKKDVEDKTLPEGTSKIIQEGVEGALEITYEVTYVDGMEIGRQVKGNEVIQEAIPEIVAVGPPETFIEVKEEVETETVPYEKQRFYDDKKEISASEVTQKGENGEKVTVYHVTYTDGVETSREIAETKIIKQTVPEITIIGTRGSSKERKEEKIITIPYERQTIQDAQLDKGLSEVTQVGVNGEVKVVEEVTYSNGVETGRKEISRTVIKETVPEIVTEGTKPVPVIYTIIKANGEVMALTGTPNRVEAEAFLAKLNEERKLKGLNELTINEELMKAAEQRAAEIAVHFEHERPDGSAIQGVSPQIRGENILKGNNMNTVDEAYGKWYSSEGHRYNMLYPDYTETGVAFVYFPNEKMQYHWVQVFK